MVQVVGRVVGRDLLGDRIRGGVVGLALVDAGELRREVGRRVDARRRVVAGGGAERVQAADERLLLDPDRRGVVGRAGDRVVERAAVGLERVREVGPRDGRRRRGDTHGMAAVADPGVQVAVGVHVAVLQGRQLHRLAARVRGPGHADALAVDQALVGQLAGQELGVARLVAHVGQVQPARRAAGGVEQAVVGAPARAVEPARRVREDRVAARRPGLHLVEPDLAPAPAV